MAQHPELKYRTSLSQGTFQFVQEIRNSDEDEQNYEEYYQEVLKDMY